MKPGRLPEDNPLEQLARDKLRELSPAAQRALREELAARETDPQPQPRAQRQSRERERW